MNKNYKIIWDLKNGKVTIPEEIITFDTDKNIFKLNLEICDNLIVLKNKDLKDKKIELFASKPPQLKEWVSCEGKLEEKSNIFLFDLPTEFSDIRGAYKCELRLIDEINDTIMTSSPFLYRVQGSVTTNGIKEEKQIIQKIEPRVIDNLLTTNPSIALSAKQGYELNNKINSLIKEFDEKIEKILKQKDK